MSDVDGDGFIDADEMQSYLTAVFRVMYESDPSIRARTGVTPEELAAATTQVCFAEADADGDGRLSFEVRHRPFVLVLERSCVVTMCCDLVFAHSS
jgi:hypothetical protein